MPDGLKYLSRCVAADLGRSFQLMEADDITLLQRWIAGCSDLMAFEIVPVGRAQALEQARPLGQTLRLFLGRRHSCSGPAGDDAQCLLVIIGATPEGKKELVGLTDGVRESTRS